MQTLPELVTAAQQGDLDAFSEIVTRFQSMAYTSAYTMLEDAQLAEDVVQEAFIEAYLNLSKLREAAAFPGWLRRIIFKQGDRLTRGKHFNTVPLEATPGFDIILDELNPATLLENGETRRFVQRAVATLAEHERTVTLLFYGNGYALKDIAAFLEVPLSTVKKRLFDARKHLKELLLVTVQDTLQELQPARPADFPARIQLLIAIRNGDMNHVQAMLKRNPHLINSNLGWKGIQAPLAQRYQSLPPYSTALEEALTSNHAEMVTLLLDCGANINAHAFNGMTPLHHAVSSSQPGLVKLLLKRGAEPGTQSSQGLSPLHLASMKDSSQCVHLLLSYGSPVDIRSHAGLTALHWAALKGHAAIAKLLLQAGANQHIHDEMGRTPLDWAVVRGHHTLAADLQQYGQTNVNQAISWLK